MPAGRASNGALPTKASGFPRQRRRTFSGSFSARRTSSAKRSSAPASASISQNQSSKKQAGKSGLNRGRGKGPLSGLRSPLPGDIDTFDGVPTSPFEARVKAPLSINPEYTPAFRPESRRVDSYMAKIPASVQILTFNNRDTIERCLQSVQDFDDIIVLDGGSTDGTLDVLARYGVRIYPQHEDWAFSGPISDFSAVRNRGFDRARYSWFIYIDSDEFFPPETVEEIASIIRASAPSHYLWYISRN